MRTILLAFLLSFAAVAARAQDTIQLVERTALGGKVAVLAPGAFIQMTPEMLRTKYRGDRPPTEAFSDARGTVNIAFRQTPATVTPDQVGQVHVILEREIRSALPSGRIDRSEVVRRGDRDFGVLDFWSSAVDTDVRNIMVMTVLEGAILIVTFNVTRELEGEWGAIGERIMNSIRVIE